MKKVKSFNHLHHSEKIGLLLLLIFLNLSTIAQQIHFAHVTDLHVGGSTGAQDLEKTIVDLNRQENLQFVLFTGDITEFGSDEELLLARTIINRLRLPWYILPGNHDSKWSESGNNSFVTIFGSEHFEFEKGGFHFIGTASGPNMRMAPGLVPREQIVFLDSVLSSLSQPRQPVIFVNHYPLDESLGNWYEVTERLHRVNIKATLLGHGHTNQRYDFEGIPGIMGRSNLQTKQVEAGYNLVTIQQDTIYYNERLNSGKTLPCWAKVPLHEANPQKMAVAQASKPISANYPRPDYTVNDQYPKTKVIWSYQEKSDIGTGLSYAGNILLFANTKGEIVALNRKSGKKIWCFATGGKIYSTPAISQHKVVCASTDHNIYCLDLRSGKKLWMHPTAKPIVASPAIESDRVYIGSSEGSFRCIALEDGKLIWRFDGVNNFVECKPLILNKSVCFGSWGNTFYSLDKATGKLNWKREKYTNRMLSPAALWPVAAHGKIFLVAPDRHMTALNAETGAEIWDSGKYSCRESIGISSDGSLVYIKNMTEGNVDAFDTSSQEQKLVWECNADLGYEIAPSPIVESKKVIFVPSSSGKVVAIDKKTHSVVWKYKVSNALINAILPIGNKKILISTMDGKVMGMRL